MLDRFSGRSKPVGALKVGELINKADAARDLQRWSDAADLYRVALDQDPELPDIWIQYGHALKESGSYDKAEEAYKQGLQRKDVADTHLQLGHLHKLMGHKRLAEQDYLRAFERNPSGPDARAELGRMGWNGKRLRDYLSKTSGIISTTTDIAAFIVFELSDLIDHLQRSRYPTGIQRVQLALGAALAEEHGEDRVQFVYYDHLQSDFFEVPARQVLDLFDLVQDATASYETQKTLIETFKGALNRTQPFEFPDGAYLVNVGTSWGFHNYFLSIREIKRRSHVRYVPMVHDCIPLIYPEFCNPDLVRDFINWISQMLSHADLILTNSENTRSDVVKVAKELEVALPGVVTIHLNGEYGTPDGVVGGADRTSRDVLRAHNLDFEDFVLLVSTIEPRKNHMLALNAWSRMLKTRPRSKVPRFVCVGSSGWMNDAFYQRLAADAQLRERVFVLQNVSEQVLQLLYTRCLFTLFPSLYEGWGLPISEALAHGKVPLVSNISSHPEAGGDLAVYFDLNSEADFQAKLEHLIDDQEARRAREDMIKKSRPLRPWKEIGTEVFATIEAHLADNPAASKADEALDKAPPIVCGRYYSLARNMASDIPTMVYSGDIYRAGVSWYGPESFGCWIRGRSADIAFSIAPDEGDDFIVYLHLAASHNIDNGVTLTLPPANLTKRVEMPRGAERWKAAPVRFAPQSKREVRLRITADAIDDFRGATEGRDSRISSIGVKGFYVCKTTDSVQRAMILEAIQFHDLHALAQRFSDAVML